MRFNIKSSHMCLHTINIIEAAQEDKQNSKRTSTKPDSKIHEEIKSETKLNLIFIKSSSTWKLNINKTRLQKKKKRQNSEKKNLASGKSLLSETNRTNFGFKSNQTDQNQGRNQRRFSDLDSGSCMFFSSSVKFSTETNLKRKGQNRNRKL